MYAGICRIAPPCLGSILAGVGLVLVVFALMAGKSILGLIGADYVAAQPLMVLLLIAASFELSSASLRAAAYAMGSATHLLPIHVLGVIAYVVAFLLLTQLLGLIGAGLATIITSLLTLWLTIVLAKACSSDTPHPVSSSRRAQAAMLAHAGPDGPIGCSATPRQRVISLALDSSEKFSIACCKRCCSSRGMRPAVHCSNFSQY